MSTDVYGIFSLRSKGREEMSASAWGAYSGIGAGGGVRYCVSLLVREKGWG